MSRAGKEQKMDTGSSIMLKVLVTLTVLPLAVLTAPSHGSWRKLVQQNHDSPARPRVVDLSHTIDLDTIFWPGFPGFNYSHLIRGRTPAGFWIEANWVSTSEHGGTHVDAPAHFVEGGEHLGELPVDKFFGPAVLIDAAEHAAVDSDFQLGVTELQNWEAAHGQIPQQAVVLVRFGWSSRWPDRHKYLNTETPDDTRTLHFPGVGVQALRWLVYHRDVKMMGVDVPSIDYGQTKDFPGHQFLCSNRIPFVESLTNLQQLPPREMDFFAVPLRLVGGSGFPVRAFALLNGAGLGHMDLWSWALVIFVVLLTDRVL